jgi:hypothetical protein
MHKHRALVVSLVALAAAIAAYGLRTFGPSWMPGCLFRSVTGWECPGCGMTRGTYALLHGQIRQAFAFNPVGMILLPLGLVAMGVELIGWIRGKSLPVRIYPGGRGAWAMAGVVMVWLVWRNVM